MKKMKKVLALIMAMAMVLGMGLTTMAAENVDIVVHNLEADTTVAAVQVIVPSPGKVTGWDFADDDIKDAYASAFGKTDPTDKDYQDIIWSLIGYADTSNRITLPSGISDATLEEITAALNNINQSKFTLSAKDGTTNVFNVSSAGVYAILATPASGSDTVYSRMAAYVNFTYNDNGIPTLPEDDVDVYAKKSSVPVEKTAPQDPEGATGISETVSYKVTTAVPYGLSEWKFTDTITNASYVVVSAGDEDYGVNTAGKVRVSVKVGTDPTESATLCYATINNAGLNDNQQHFELDLTELLDEQYGQQVTLTYDAVVTGTEVGNSIQYDNTHKSDEVKLYTGSITFTKLEEETNNKLGGARFKVYRAKKGTTDDYEYAQFSGRGPSYQLTGWGTEEEATIVTTDITETSNTFGTLTVTGLDKGTYYFKEVVAPTGYSINETPVEVELGENLSEDQKAEESFSATGSMEDTRLAALPSTGGIGTTIFTVGGCIIMIAAAALFFMNRRKSEE